jgi:hypothetical protein
MMMILGIKRARWPTYIFLELPRATNFAVVSACLSFEKERRGKMHHFFFTLLCCFCLSFVVLLYNNHHRLIENKALRINSVVAVVIASQSSTVCG